jgi:GDP-L-fucose synthase
MEGCKRLWELLLYVREKMSGMNTSSKIYVAGHDGMVGSAIMRKLNASGYHNIITQSFAQLDLRNQQAVNVFFAAEKPEYVFLAAAKVGGILANNTYKAEFIYDNLMIATNVIHAAYTHGVKKLLNLGSSCIYPKHAPQPLKEEYLLSGPLEPTNEPYAMAKIAAIKLCRYYNEQYGTNFISVMPTNMYGPNDNYNLETAHVLPALIRKFHLAKLLKNHDMVGLRNNIMRYKLGHGFDTKVAHADDAMFITMLSSLGITQDAVCLWGSGEPYREFMYVDDLADVVLRLMQQYDASAIGEIINIGTGHDLKIKELAELVQHVVGAECVIMHDTTKPDGMLRKLLDTSKLTTLCPHTLTSLEAGIEQAYAWYLMQTGGQTYKESSCNVSI